MRHLVLMRHAEAEPARPGQADFERPLSEQGEHDAALMGRLLQPDCRAPDLVLASPARRTRRSAEIVAAALAYPPADIRFDAALYNARTSVLFAACQDLEPELERVVLVAHNPGITELCAFLLQQWVPGLPPGACVCLALEVDEWSELAPGAGRLLAMRQPPH